MKTKVMSVWVGIALAVPTMADGQVLAAPSGAVERTAMVLPDHSSFPQDPADSLYRLARRTLSSGEYLKAAELFEQLRERHQASSYVAEAYYWEAFARYRTNSASELSRARGILDALEQAHPQARVAEDARVLATRIAGRLAREGDVRAAERVARAAAPRPVLADVAPPASPRGPRVPRAPEPTVSVGVVADAPVPMYSPEQDDIRITALNALMQMDAERAVPILRQVLERRDAESVDLRRKAIFLLAQKRTADTEELMLDVARSDPNVEVRAEAVMWLSQVPTAGAVSALDSILQQSDDERVQERAIFALGQHPSERAGAALRAYIERDDVPPAMRERAILYLSHQPSSENAQFLKGLYGRVEDRAVKERIVMSLAQRNETSNAEWLRGIYMNAQEDLELRKRALFWSGQSGGLSVADMVTLYEQVDDPELREQLIFAVAQQDGSEAVDFMIRIAEDDSNKELQARAVFWLGQSKDPRAAEFLVQLINRNPS